MYQSKFMKAVWAINGIIILLLCIIGLILLLTEIIPKLIDNKYEYSKGVIIGEDKDNAKKLNIDLQHLVYATPIKIQRTNYYYANVHVVDIDVPEEVFDRAKRANDFSIDLLGGTINVIFYDDQNEEAYPLLKDFGYISYMDVPTYYRNIELEKQKKINHILYKIALYDTDGNGRINRQDESSYYISDLTGKNLIRITPDSLKLQRIYSEIWDDKIYFEEVIKLLNKDEQGFPLKLRNIYFYDFKTKRFQKAEKLQSVFDTLQKNYKDSK